MKSFIYKSGMLALFAGVLLTSCDPEVEAPSLSAGTELDFTNYVAIGNSLTAGYADGGLYLEGQLNSFPNILAQQFKAVGGGDFVQPLFSQEQRNGSGYLRLQSITNGSPVTEPVTTNLAVRQDVTPLPGGPRLTKYTDPVQNMGVPGISVLSSFTPLYGAINPYFERLLTDAEVGSKNYITKVAETQPSFFTLWLGNNDILTYATNGAVADLANPFSDKTPVASFTQIYSGMVNALTQGGAEGVVANIPYVTSVPFFTTVTQDAIRQAAGSNELVIYIRVGAGATDVRPIESGDLILLTTRANIGRIDNVPTPQGAVPIPHGFHPANPLTDREVLDKDEVAEVNTHTDALNAVIDQVAATFEVPVFDVNEYFTSIQPRVVNGQAMPSLVLNGVAYSPAFITGNLFSLDGIHLTPRGNAIVANEFIKVINNAYNAQIPLVDETQYRTVQLP